MRKILILIVITLFASQAFSWMTYAILGGSRISDKKETIYSLHDQPFDSVKYEDGAVGYMFWRDKNKNAYIAYEIFPEDTSRIWSIQISAQDTVFWEGLNGVNLTSSVETLLKKFGKPSEKNYLSDVKSYQYLYKNCNASFEVHNGKVNSIKIMTTSLKELKLLEEYKDKIHVEY